MAHVIIISWDLFQINKDGVNRLFSLEISARSMCNIAIILVWSSMFLTLMPIIFVPICAHLLSHLSVCKPYMKISLKAIRMHPPKALFMESLNNFKRGEENEEEPTIDITHL